MLKNQQERNVSPSETSTPISFFSSRKKNLPVRSKKKKTMFRYTCSSLWGSDMLGSVCIYLRCRLVKSSSSSSSAAFHSGSLGSSGSSPSIADIVELELGESGNGFCKLGIISQKGLGESLKIRERCIHRFTQCHGDDHDRCCMPDTVLVSTIDVV